MREILFRGKRKDNSKWVEGWYVPPVDYSGRHWDASISYKVKAGHLEDVEAIPETVEQYTGLTDKSGKKIFEGDILESRASENKEDWKRWLVTFYDGSFCFERELPRKRKHKYVQNLLCEDEIKLYHLTVIGNIHDTPELLKEGGE